MPPQPDRPQQPDIRILGPGADRVLAAVAPGVFDHQVSPDLAFEFLRDQRHHIAVALDGGLVVGFASAVHYVHPDKPAELWINEVGVAATHHRRGLGRALLGALLEHGRALGCREAWVLTERDNEAARKLYAAAGGVELSDATVHISFPLEPLPAVAAAADGTGIAELPVIRTPRLVLRPYRASDAPDLQRLVGDAAVALNTVNIQHPYPDGAAEEWIAGHAAAAASGTSLTLAITDGTDELRGAIGLQLRLRHRRAEIGYWIGRPWWSRGYATEAVRAMLAWAFANLPLERIDATHYTRNPASGRVMEKAGMSAEGTHRQYFVRDGRGEDVVRYAILRAEAAQLGLGEAP